MFDLIRMRNEHEQLADISRRLLTVIGEKLPPPLNELFTLRQELASALILHLKTEDWVLYPRLLASPDKRVSETAQLFSDEMGGLASEFKAHSERWGSLAIHADWNGYQVETADLLETLARRVNREDRELYPLLDAMEAEPFRRQA